MDVGWFMGLVGFAFAMAATPGPNNTMVTARSATYGLARTLPLMIGITLGVAGIMLIAAAVGASLVQDPWVDIALKWTGATYLLWLAWKIASADPEPAAKDRAKPIWGARLCFTQGVVLQCVNPKLWVMVSVAVVAYGPASGKAEHLPIPILFAAVFGAMTFLSTAAWAALGASIGRFLASRRSIRAFNIAMAALLIASLIPVIVG